VTLVLTGLNYSFVAGGHEAWGYDTDEDTIGHAEPSITTTFDRTAMRPVERVHHPRRLAYQDWRGRWCLDVKSTQRVPIPIDLRLQIEKALLPGIAH
jgi:hypothetical protein